MRRLGLLLLPTLALVAAFTAPIFARPSDPIATLARAAMAAPEPVTAVLQGFAKLPDFEVDGASVAASLAAAGVPTTSVLQQVLGNVTKVKKSGNTVEITRGDPVVIPIVVAGKPQGYVGLDTDAEFSVTDTGKEVKIDGTSGITVGQSSDSLYDLKSIVVDLAGAAPKVTLTASWLFVSKSETFQLPAPAPAPAPKTSTSAQSVANSGLGDDPLGTRATPSPDSIALTPQGPPAPAKPSQNGKVPSVSPPSPSVGLTGALSTATSSGN